ncbi:MAG: carboxymuconolactone decarboxylase family protein [Planctomycetes bacterium]|nr:carboxymuconolactone decarboxylase family protein [Planctomycetota bacterium]
MSTTTLTQNLPLVDPASATGKPGELLQAVKGKLGLIPNMTKAMANAPAALDGYLAFSGALSHGVLSARVREQIAILTAEYNRCHYCLSAHTAIAKMVGLPEGDAAQARDAKAADAKTTAILTFAKAILVSNGSPRPDQFEAARKAGVSDAEIAEIIANVALNYYTNIFNKAAGTEVDFPIVNPR